MRRRKVDKEVEQQLQKTCHGLGFGLFGNPKNSHLIFSKGRNFDFSGGSEIAFWGGQKTKNSHLNFWGGSFLTNVSAFCVFWEIVTHI